ncbi:MAG: HPr family phosphocarrier protein [Pirellulaceae bacterium]
MAEQTVSRTVVIPNQQGLHARPADQFVKLANQFSAQIEIQRETLTVNGKSILDLLTLAAEQGTELILHATGDDATEASEALAALVESFAEHDLEGEEDA